MSAGFGYAYHAGDLAESRHSQLQSRTAAFCAAFLDFAHNPPDRILAEHFVPATPRITEHGPAWAAARLPFLGTTFAGRDACLEYFRLLGSTLALELGADTFPPRDAYVVDARAAGGGMGCVTLVGKARFTASSTGVAWDEEFIWKLSGFDDEGRIGHWEIWADPLSAWLAVGGEPMG